MPSQFTSGIRANITDEEIEVKIAEYLLDNPKPKDIEFHAFSQGIGVDKDRVEEVAYRMLSTVLRTSALWNVLNREEAEINTLLYVANVSVDNEVDMLMSENNMSNNMAHLCVRLRNVDTLRRVEQHRNTVLSHLNLSELSPEEEVDDEVFMRKYGDSVVVTDSGRITEVNNQLESLGMGQSSIDTVIRLLELDRFVNESMLLNTSYNSLREALVQTTNEEVFDDPQFLLCSKLLNGADMDRRDQGPQIRAGKIRDVCGMMRDLTARYGSSNTGLFSGITNVTR